MITDAELDRESPEDEPFVLADSLAKWIDRRAGRRGAENGSSLGYGLRTVSELAFVIASKHPRDAEAIASQLENMAAYVRRNSKTAEE